MTRFLLPLLAILFCAPFAEARDKPNIIFILADDLGYGDLGSYGQKRIRTPNLDALAKNGMRFTQFYAGSTVCAPSRCVLMTGLHTGHCLVRGNAKIALRPQDVTIATLLKRLGYVTGLIGKWGLGENGTTGVPTKQGFDTFFGYLNQTHAHNYYPDHLFRNETMVKLEGNVVEKGVASKRAIYSHDLFAEEALEFVEKHKKDPFFLYLAFTIPHANNEAGKAGMEVPSDEPYSKEAWPQPQKNHAAMITRMDRDIGRLMEKLKELGIADDTIILFSSDNGPHREGGNDPTFNQSSGQLRGIKRSMHDGGIRVPFIVVWNGKIRPGVSDHIGYFADILPTLVQLAGGKDAPKSDGISFAPALLGQGKQAEHLYLYWEFFEGGFQQALRLGDWKGIRKGLEGKLELYNLKTDIGEEKDVAAEHPQIVARLEMLLRMARVDSPDWPTTGMKKKK